MRLGIVFVVFRKEFLDVIRDRRTLISMILLPILIFPLLIGGIGSLTAGQMEKLENRASSIITLGGDRAEELIEVVKQNEGLQLITSIGDSSVASQMLAERVVQGVLYIPPTFQAGGSDENLDHQLNSVQIWYDKSQTESELAMRKLKNGVSAYRDTVVRKRIEALNLSASIIEPFGIDTQNRASGSQMAGAILGMLLPYIVILLTIVGSTYAAIDLTAGEKERGTMETLLVCPASRLELVLGKFLTTMTVGSITAILAVISLTVTFFGPGSIIKQDLGAEVQFNFDPVAFGMVFLLLVPMAALFAAVLIAIAINARSYKEAQSYVYPVILLAIVPAIASMMPGLETSVKMSLIPVVSVSLILRDAFMGIFDTGAIVSTFIASIVYAGFAIFVAVRIFQKESVLLRI